ncbi:MAG: hypothetical protein PVG49_14945 [Desulfobacteraceae bacterium]|jgi:hypothetical protein
MELVEILLFPLSIRISRVCNLIATKRGFGGVKCGYAEGKDHIQGMEVLFPGKGVLFLTFHRVAPSRWVKDSEPVMGFGLFGRASFCRC